MGGSGRPLHAEVLIGHTLSLRKAHTMAIATQPASSQPETAQTQDVDFYFDVSCPWAWRTALWIREVAKVRPIQVTWKFLSLAKINEAGDYSRDSHAASHATFPLLARARAQGGNTLGSGPLRVKPPPRGLIVRQSRTQARLEPWSPAAPDSPIAGPASRSNHSQDRQTAVGRTRTN